MADRWLAHALPDRRPAVADPEPEPGPPLDPELVAVGARMVEAVTRLQVERDARERATGRRWRLRLSAPQWDVHGTPSATFRIDLVLDGEPIAGEE